MKRISMVISPDLAAMGYNPPSAPSGCIMTVRLKDGTELVERVEKGPWEPPNVPAAPVIGDTRAVDAFDAACDIDTMPNLDALMALLRT